MKNFLDYASQKYYEGSPIIEDTEFDVLAQEYGYQNVGVPAKAGIVHTFPMYSLKKCYVGEKIIDLDGEIVETPKLDGAAVSLLYIGGKLKLALTRGNGTYGLDITEKMKFLVENKLQTNQSLFQINGEVVAPKSIPNSRNYAAGALNLKNIEEFKERKLTFVAHAIQPSLNETYTEDMSALNYMGFYDVYGLASTVVEKWPTDGKVVRLNNNKAFEDAGYTSTHPRGAYALKERVDGVVTKLLGVEWQVGRTGQISPVAILEPVLIGEAMVSRATLHNLKYIQELGLEIGCDVEIVRAGEIIPRVVRRV